MNAWTMVYTASVPDQSQSFIPDFGGGWAAVIFILALGRGHSRLPPGSYLFREDIARTILPSRNAVPTELVAQKSRATGLGPTRPILQPQLS